MPTYPATTGLCGRCGAPLDDHGYDGKAPLSINGGLSQPPRPASECPVKAGPKLRESWVLPE